MDIAIDCNIFTQQKYGGVSRYVVRLAEGLAAREHNVRIHGILHINSYLADSVSGLTRMRSIKKIPKFCRRFFHRVSDLYSNAELSLRPPDLIHESYFQARGVGSTALPRICTVHDMIHDLFPNQDRSADYTRLLRQRTLARADAVICISETTRNDLISITGINPEKTHVVHHGYESMCSKPDLSSNEERLSFELVDKPFILYVGRRGGYKNFEGFIEGFAKCCGSEEINIIAFGGGALNSHEHEQIAKAGIPPGHVMQIDGSDDLLRFLYQNAIALVFPSFYEGFGFPPLEAMSAGCPVLASNASCIPEIAGDAAIYFDPRESVSIAHALDIVLSSDHNRLHSAQAGYQQLENFSWRKCAGETLKIYETIV